MSAVIAMRTTIEERGATLRNRLQSRLQDVARLRCSVHDEGVAAVVIHGRENGWFDSRWTTCCDRLEREAAAIVGHRC